MVLQRESKAPIWGWATPGAKVDVNGSWGAKASATADGKGAWKVVLQTPAAGEGLSVTYASGESKIVHDDVASGEVWICSGQSNMEMYMADYRSPAPIVDWQKEVAAADIPQVRLFQVTRQAVTEPAATCQGAWSRCTPQSVGPFSAVAYYFGRQLYSKLKVPIGLIHTSWGGTEVELWASEEALKKNKDLAESLTKYQGADERNRKKNEDWQKQIIDADPGAGGNWTQKDLDESTWEPITELLPWSKSGWTDNDGVAYYRARFELTEEDLKQPVILRLGNWDDNDRTFVNGNLVGLANEWSVQRNYLVNPKFLEKGMNTMVIRMVDEVGEGGPGNPQQFVQIGAQKTAPLTKWVRKFAVDFKKFVRPVTEPFANHSILYNGMINPLVPYRIRGAIWYQGESNVGRAFQYRQSFPLMIADWRRAFQSANMPFLFVQIAPFQYNNNLSPELRDAQAWTQANIPNTGMVSTMDLVTDFGNIHPVRKREVGERLGDLALAETYKTMREAHGPQFASVKFGANSTAEIKFTHAGGLKGDVKNFTVAGDDMVFKPAEGTIEGDKIILTCPAVWKPVAVRYCWTDTSVATIWNGAGLPMEQFRTDKWPLVTQPFKW